MFTVLNIMKKLLLIILCFPLVTLAQKKTKGYGFIGAGIHFIEKTENIAARLNIGLLPAPNVGIGLDVQYIRDYGAPILGDFRFISPNMKGIRLTIAAKLGTNIYDKSTVKGGFVYGGEAGLIIGKGLNGFYISAQYLSMQYNSKIASFNVNDLGLTIGVKF